MCVGGGSGGGKKDVTMQWKLEGTCKFVVMFARKAWDVKENNGK